ncbi:MAG TPA: hypothetical protein PKN14_09645 [Bacteroidia bacterium]|nr:hypothetical protein [Bacteroidia bacterium]HNR49495.1 hypothetical protein [Bacteroidia bacterium]HNT83272.1 hypothetical protein [Bacteroidia bacterium]
MTSENYTCFVYGWIALAVIIFFVLMFVTAPYGRHTKTTWGPLIDNRLGWMLMEIFVLLVLFWFVFTGKNQQSFTNLLIISFFAFHYFNRSIIFPLRLKTKGKKMPVVITLMGLTFNLVNGFIIGYYLGNFKIYDREWLSSIPFITGTIIFFAGLTINWWSDGILIGLRKYGESGYKIPEGKLFHYVSCPNLMGEIIEWCGFAILTWSLPGLAFFIWTFCNLVPRAISHHKWYNEKFENYPKNRKAVIPFVI